MLDKIIQLKNRFAELENQLQSGEVATNPQRLKTLSQEYSDLKEKVALGSKYESVARSLAEAEKTKEESTDSEMIALANEEIERLTTEKNQLELDVEKALLPPNPHDHKNIIVEIRAAAGGDESALFAAELFRMYSRYAERNNWQTHMLSANRIGIGGYKEVVFEIKGYNAYAKLKYESGVHRVQRVPETEKSGRVHTSTVTVAIMPEMEAVDLAIDPKDLKIETSTARGNGGQSVNTTYSAIRMTHLPTGIMVSMQDEKSQQQNREKALLLMTSRVAAHYEALRAQKERDARLSQIGTGDRSEKIRTYNFPQDRVTDHRIGQNWHGIPAILDGELDDIIQVVQSEDIKLRLAALGK